MCPSLVLGINDGTKRLSDFLNGTKVRLELSSNSNLRSETLTVQRCSGCPCRSTEPSASSGVQRTRTTLKARESEMQLGSMSRGKRWRLSSTAFGARSSNYRQCESRVRLVVGTLRSQLPDSHCVHLDTLPSRWTASHCTSTRGRTSHYLDPSRHGPATCSTSSLRIGKKEPSTTFERRRQRCLKRNVQ